jgi:hypothetical protein
MTFEMYKKTRVPSRICDQLHRHDKLPPNEANVADDDDDDEGENLIANRFENKKKKLTKLTVCSLLIGLFIVL